MKLSSYEIEILINALIQQIIPSKNRWTYSRRDNKFIQLNDSILLGEWHNILKKLVDELIKDKYEPKA